MATRAFAPFGPVQELNRPYLLHDSFAMNLSREFARPQLSRYLFVQETFNEITQYFPFPLG